MLSATVLIPRLPYGLLLAPAGLRLFLLTLTQISRQSNSSQAKHESNYKKQMTGGGQDLENWAS